MTRAAATARYWLAASLAMEAHRSRRRNCLALQTLDDICNFPPSERLACAAGGTLVTLGEETGERREN
jgi:hypothetical protein